MFYQLMTEQKTRTILGIFAILIIVTTPILTSSHPAFATSSTGVIVPLYSYPGSYWNQLIQAKNAHPSVPIVAIINPNNGPGSSIDSTYVSSVQQLQSAGIQVLGYVATGYGSNSQSSEESQVNSYINWYHVDGIFFDEMANWSGLETYYATLNNYVHNHGLKMTVGNPGADTLSSYIGTMDNLVIYENPGLPTTTNLGGWHTSYAKTNFSYMAYGVSLPSLSYVTSTSSYVSYIYITNDGGDNPYDTVPSYFGTEVADLDTGSSVVPTAPSAPTGLTATAASASQINLSWTAPSNNGGSAVTGYKIERSNNGGSTWSTVVSNTGSIGTTYASTGLTANASYTFRVSAINLVGTSSPSSTASATTSTTSTGGTVTITVKTVGLSGNTITGLWTTLISGGSATKSGYTTKIYSVTAGHTYTVTVANYNNYVFDHWSNGSTNSNLVITPTQSVTLTAYYQQ